MLVNAKQSQWGWRIFSQHYSNNAISAELVKRHPVVANPCGNYCNRQTEEY